MRALELCPNWLTLNGRLAPRVGALGLGRVRLRDLPAPPRLRLGQVALAVRLAGVSDGPLTARATPEIGREIVGRVVAPHGHDLIGRTVIAAPDPGAALALRVPLLAEFIVAPEDLVFAAPDGLDDERSLFAEPYARILTVLRRNPPSQDEQVLVISEGAQGLLAVLCLTLHFGCHSVHAVVPTARERRIALALGARGAYMGREGPAVAVQAATGARLTGRTGGLLRFSSGFDRVVDFAGSPWSIGQALSVGREGAAIDLCAELQRPLDLAAASARGLHLRGTVRTLTGDGLRSAFSAAMADLSREEARPVTDLVTGRYRLEEYGELLKACRARDLRGRLRLVFDLRS